MLYVAGWGRSGSTLLDTALGSFPGVVSTGELRYLWERGLAQARRCGCGRPVPACPFWQGVLARVERARRGRGARPSRPAAADVVALQDRVARTRHAPGIAGRDDPGLRALRGLTGDLARAVVAEAGAQVLVDSSKMPADGALYLRAGDDVQLHVVHLVRDPRAVAHSWQRPKLMTDLAVPVPIDPHCPAASSRYWLGMNLLAERLGRHAVTYRRVRYEDLVADPATVLGTVLADAGLAPDVDAVVTPDGLRVAPNHTVAGNPSRFADGLVALRPDEAWRTDQPPGHRVAATLPALPLLRRYGYPLPSAGVAP